VTWWKNVPVDQGHIGAVCRSDRLLKLACGIFTPTTSIGRRLPEGSRRPADEIDSEVGAWAAGAPPRSPVTVAHGAGDIVLRH